MLGEKEGKPILLLEPIYSIRERGDIKVQALLDAPLEEIKETLNLELVLLAENVSLLPSHNPEGYYRDI